MLPTDFDVSKHGFHFSNNDIEWEVHPGSIRGKNLCGGMIYAALDTFLCSHTAPPDTDPPPRGTPMNQYIVQRQLKAHNKTLPRLAGQSVVFGLFSYNNWYVDSLASEFDKIRRWVAAKCPAPLFLVMVDTMHAHHVLVTGCQSSPSLGNPILTVYDPNAPDDISEISVDYRSKRFNLLAKKAPSYDWDIRGFFFDPGYIRHTPPW